MINKTEKKVIENKKNNFDSILISICCITYNHEQYITDAIESFLMQKTTFPIEILIHDDASTDNTPKIIKNYASKYPNLIKPIFQTINQYSKNKGSISVRFVWPKTKGKYIALCEGDDYWTDPYKLQKQVNFLEKNAKFSMCYHRVDSLVRNKIIKDKKVRNSEETTISLAKNIGIPSLSVVFRNFKIKEPPELKGKITGSLFWFMQISKYGKIKFIDETMAVYRVHSGGIWSGKDSYNKANMQLKNKESMIIYFKNNILVKNELIKSHVRICTSYFLSLTKQKKFIKAFKIFKRSFKYGISIFHLKYLIKICYQTFYKLFKRLIYNQ